MFDLDAALEELHERAGVSGEVSWVALQEIFCAACHAKEAKEAEQFYHVGQRFTRPSESEEYIIALVGRMPNRLMLISAETGIRFSVRSAEVADPQHITEEELKDLQDGFIFTLVKGDDDG